MTERTPLPEPLPLALLPVHIAKVHIKDFRAIVQLDLEFSTRLAVFVGDNQAGKTTVLRAIAAGLGGSSIPEFRQPPDFSGDARKSAGGSHEPEVTLGAKSGKNTNWTDPFYGLDNLWPSGMQSDLFPAERRLEDLIGDFDSWFRDRDTEEAKFVRDTRNLDYRHPQLEAVRAVVRTLVPGALNLRTTGVTGRLVVDVEAFDGHENVFAVEELSGGVRTFLAMVASIARTLIDADPPRGTAGPGIVFIDEIDLHLHPGWQLRVLPGLLRTFPSVQFFVTTHSEQVVSSVPSECVYVLSRGPDGVTASAPPAVEGAAAERILEDVMGVSKRPKEVEAQLAQYFDLIARDRGESDDAKAIRAWLDDRFKGQDPDLVAADFEIRRRKLRRQSAAG
ncbi:MAG: AAA family ATPase [Myxococcales bacterium]|nr:AAA family ATPase [Myxococcales bacterium]